jgi:hypothetical protein
MLLACCVYCKVLLVAAEVVDCSDGLAWLRHDWPEVVRMTLLLFVTY